MNAGLALFIFLTMCSAAMLAGTGVDNLRHGRVLGAWLVWLSGAITGGLGLYALVCFIGAA